MLVGAVGSLGGTNPAGANKFVPAPFSRPRPQQVWSELLYPRQWPLAHHELSFLLPHMLKRGVGRIDRGADEFLVESRLDQPAGTGDR